MKPAATHASHTDTSDKQTAKQHSDIASKNTAMGKETVDSVATPEHTPQLQAFCQVVESRRSVRRFTDTPIPDEVLADCLRLAMLAPNSSNLQPWEFYVIDSPDKRQRAVKKCMN